jgi:hypothetical protein
MGAVRPRIAVRVSGFGRDERRTGQATPAGRNNFATIPVGKGPAAIAVGSGLGREPRELALDNHGDV